MKLFEAVDVWRQGSMGSLVQYRCFRVWPSGGYCVQSADYYYVDKDNSHQFEKQFIELLSEQAPDERSEVFDTLEEAVINFDLEFREMIDE